MAKQIKVRYLRGKDSLWTTEGRYIVAKNYGGEVKTVGVDKHNLR